MDSTVVKDENTGKKDLETKKAVTKSSKTMAKTAEITASKQEAGDVEEPVKVTKPIVAREVDMNQYITVKNGFQGRLVYKSKRTGEKFVWDAFGDEQEMQISELKNARNSSKDFFRNNWFMFDEENMWVISFLGLEQYYKHAIPIDKFDDIFSMPVDKVQNIISELSDGQRKSLAYRAGQLISEGKIDSNKMISMLESCLGIELIQK